ncbi:MAG: PINc protein, partial [Candidatus Poribacteria bacterium]|nr:PINc protein [Candidatus Poribacteria bacterium]
ISSILVRKKNAKQISESFYHHAFAEFKKELLDDTNISIQSVKDNLVRESLLFVEKYSLNATDAIILRCALNVKYTLMTDDDLVLVTTDIRLSNAAKSSGLKVWNPETDSQLDEDV